MNDLSADARTILETGRAALAPSAHVRARLREAVAVRVASAPAIAVSAAGSGIKLVVLSCLAIVVVAGTFVAWRMTRTTNHTATATRVAPEVASAAPIEVPQPVVHELEPESPPPAVSSPPRRPPTPRAGLAEELALLEKARAALRAGSSADAISMLDRHRREIPSPQLEREALLLRAEALCAEGDREAAGRILDVAAARWPTASGITAVRSRCQPPAE